MNWKSYGTKKTTPNRRARKGQRNTVFQHNRKLRARAERERRVQRSNDM